MLFDDFEDLILSKFSIFLHFRTLYSGLGGREVSQRLRLTFLFNFCLSILKTMSYRPQTIQILSNIQPPGANIWPPGVNIHEKIIETKVVLNTNNA